MSRAAEAWFFDECDIRGSRGWVLVTLCNAADDNGYASLSKKTLVAKTHMHEVTVWRVLNNLAEGDVVELCEGDFGPEWWLAIPKNRRPRLVRLTQFLGSRFATPDPEFMQPLRNPTDSGSGDVTPTPGVASDSGVAQGLHGTPSDLPVRDASSLFLTHESLHAGARESDVDDEPGYRANDRDPDQLGALLGRFRDHHEGASA